MFREISKRLFAYIMQVEQLIFRFYKIDPFSMMSRMSIIDLQGFVQGLEEQKKHDADNKNGDKLMKSLIAIRDILNYMTLPEK